MLRCSSWRIEFFLCMPLAGCDGVRPPKVLGERAGALARRREMLSQWARMPWRARALRVRRHLLEAVVHGDLRLVLRVVHRRLAVLRVHLCVNERRGRSGLRLL